MDQPASAFWEHARQSLQTGSFVKLTLSKPRSRSGDLRNIYARLVELRDEPHLSCTLRFGRRDEVKNYPVEDGLQQLQQWLEEDFSNADLFTLDAHFALMYSKKRKARLQQSAARHEEAPEREHDQPKERVLQADNKLYLTALGIAGADGKVLKKGQRKFRQINKYVEVIDHLLREHPLPAGARIVDMGSGKGYLTFALYDHLTNGLGLQPHVIGVEMRPELVDLCNNIARESGFDRLQFVAGDIESYRAESVDMLIALHACDTATDDALAKGIGANADILVVAPCCQKQVRRDMEPPGELMPMLQYGTLLEQQAVLLTDSIRALLLESRGYQTKVFEFISSEHTPKNTMITATRGRKRREALSEVEGLKEQFGLRRHRLQELLNTTG